MAFRVFLGWCFFLPGLLGHGQQPDCDCTVRGRVVERVTGQPVAGAIIYVRGGNSNTFSDSLGNYTLGNLCQGRYRLVCQLIGFDPVEVRIDLVHVLEQNVTLRENDVHLQNVVVTARRTQTTAQARAELSGDALDRTRGQSLGEALKAVTGVTSLQTGSTISKPVIHGLHSNRVLILNNGIRQEGQQWGAEHAPEVDPFVAKKITVLKGAAGVRYGADALGGVVLVEPDPLPDSSGIAGEVNLVGFSNGRQGVASGLVQGGFQNGFGWRAQGTLKRGGEVSTATYRLVNTGIREANFSLAAGYRTRRAGVDGYFSQFNTLLGIFSGSHIGSTTDLNVALQSPRPRPEYTPDQFSYRIDRPHQDVRHNLAKLRAFWRPATQGTVTLTLARQYNYRAEYDISLRNTTFQQRFRLTTYTGELLWEHSRVWKKVTGSLGLTGLLQTNLSTGQVLSLPLNRTVLIPNFRQWTSGIFAIERLVTRRWELEAGLRYDTRHLQTFQKTLTIASSNEVTETNRFNHTISGTVGAIYTLREGLTFRFHAGSAWRPPNVSELYSEGVHHGSATYEEGDAQLQPETAWNTALTANYAGKRTALELNLYRNFIQNYMYLSPQESVRLTVRGAFPYFKYTQVDATFRGFDASASVLLTPRLTLTSKYAFLRVRDVRNDRFLVNIPANRWENSLRYEFPNRAYLSLGHLLVARQTRVEPGSDFAPPPPAYWLWNASTGIILPVAGHSLNLNLDVSNLFNVAYREYLNRFRYFANDLGRNASLRAKWSF
ncbi:MAG: TonB-dependent receptor [Cytophagaceae bacterium]|nr:TonB-dependent receptor [Cytophagaceae bacterium]